MRNICSIPDCGAFVVGRGWCRRHYLRWYKTGDPLTIRVPVRGGRRQHEPGEHDATPLDTPCREWLGRRNAKGYGVVGRGGKHVRLHRYVWEAINGPIPAGMVIMHRCDNPPCFRLDHLAMGTKRDNTRDMLHKNRQSNGMARLTPEVVVAMRTDCANGMTVMQVAEKYGMTRTNTHRLLTGATWTHVGGPLYAPNPKHRRKAA